MNPAEYITAMAAVIIPVAVFIVSLSTFRRDKSKSNQDLLFHEKVKAYQELLHEGSKIYDSFMEIVNEVQHSDESLPNKEWEEKYLEFSHPFHTKAFEYSYLYKKYLAIIPSDLCELMYKFSASMIMFPTTGIHKDASIIIHGYDTLTEMIEEITEYMREDLNVDKLNTKLFHRTQ